MKRFGSTIAISLALGGSTANAGLWESLYQGLGYVVTPTGSPVNVDGNGFRVNGARAGRLRIVPNRLGQGYRLEMDRNFGPDNSGRPEIFDLGNYELELNGGIDTTMSFTTRFLPTGNALTNLGNLNYTLRGKNGVQDVQIQGTLNGTQNIEFNPLGFYTYSLDVSNANSEVRLDGVVVDNSTKDTDFDIGPINIRGNIYYDIITSMLNSVGVATSGLEQLFPESPIDRITQEIQDSLAAQARSLEARISSDLVSGVQDEALALQANQFINEALNAAHGATPVTAGSTAIPEPTAIAFFAIAGSVFLLRRR